jgi:hypothetical protein
MKMMMVFSSCVTTQAMTTMMRTLIARLADNLTRRNQQMTTVSYAENLAVTRNSGFVAQCVDPGFTVHAVGWTSRLATSVITVNNCFSGPNLCLRPAFCRLISNRNLTVGSCLQYHSKTVYKLIDFIQYAYF